MRSGFLALLGLSLAPLSGWSQSTPYISEHPVSTAAYVGDSVTFTAVVESASPATLEWRKNNVPIAGATRTTYTLLTTVADLGTSFYQITATNADGSAISVPAALFVSKRPQTITFNPESTMAIAGSGVLLSARSSANLPVTFALVSGAASLNGNILTGSGGNVVVRAVQAGNDSIAVAESIERTFSFIAGTLSPFITSPPTDATVTAGSSVTLRAVAIGTPPPTYQWQKNGVTLPAATAATFTLADVTLADSGRYTIIATNPAGTASASATLTVRAPPLFTTNPAGRAIFAGESASFAVVVTGFPIPTLQWRRNGTPITGATGATLSIVNATAADAGQYDVVATNVLGSATGASAPLAVATRDFSGIYFGRFEGATGDFALLVRADRTAVMLGSLPELQTGLTILDLRVDLSGNFSVTTVTIASSPLLSSLQDRPNTAQAPQSVTLRGSINETTGAIAGNVSELGATVAGARAPRTGPGIAYAGLYHIALLGSAAGRGYLIVGADNQALLLSASGTAADSARGAIDANGRLVATTTSQAALDLVLNNGGASGTVRSPAGAIGTIGGAIEGRIGTEHLANLSVRTVTSPGIATLITGFVVTGASAKQVLIRAAGPALGLPPFNLANAVADPTLQLFRGNTAIGQNDDWGTPAINVATLTAATTRAGAFPFRAGSADAALLTTLAPGAYSVVIGGGAGTALAEIYEVLENSEPIGARRLVNVSARGIVTPTAPFIAGFVITGTGPQRVLIRGVGPTLGATPFNVPGALPNPQLTLFRGTAPMKSNDDWFRDPDATLIWDSALRAGAFALGVSSLDAAMLVYLEPGAYTAQISGPANANPANATGIALVEIYEASP